MSDFALRDSPIDTGVARTRLIDAECGAFAAFEGWVRSHNEGKDVLRLEYEAYGALAQKEGERVLAEAKQQFDIRHAMCVHRTGVLEISDLAVWVGVSSPHRDAAFRACRYIIDEIKHRLPVWKKEYYADGDAEWVNCAACAVHAASADIRHD